jgi:hypothetical protein
MPSAENGSTCLWPSSKTISTRSTVPYWKRVTRRVHSPTSVGATLRPINALTSVDLPDLMRPATATCSGADSRRSTSRNPAAVRAETCGCSRVHRLATAADNGPARCCC